ncbi:hypothetical protein JCM10213v2_006313 [Rhodosporidiobolus nylandii]
MPVAPSLAGTLRRSGRLQPYTNLKRPSALQPKQASPTSLFVPPTVKACRVVSGPAVVGRKAKVDEEVGGEASRGVTEKGKVFPGPCRREQLAALLILASLRSAGATVHSSASSAQQATGPSIDELSCDDLLNLLESLIPAAAADDLAVLSSPSFLSFVGLPTYSPPPYLTSSYPSSLPSTPHSATFPARMDERLESAHLAVSPEGRAELVLVDTPIQSAPATAVSATSCVKELMGLGLRFERA